MQYMYFIHEDMFAISCMHIYANICSFRDSIAWIKLGPMCE